MIRKIQMGNGSGSLAVNIPIKFCRELGINRDSHVNIELKGKSIHVNVIKIE